MVIPTFPEFVTACSSSEFEVPCGWVTCGLRLLSHLPERVTPSVRVAPSDVGLAQVYSCLDERNSRGSILWRCVVDARHFAGISDAEDVDAGEVPKFSGAIHSKDLISTGTEVGLSLLEAVIKNQQVCGHTSDGSPECLKIFMITRRLWTSSVSGRCRCSL